MPFSGNEEIFFNSQHVIKESHYKMKIQLIADQAIHVV